MPVAVLGAAFDARGDEAVAAVRALLRSLGARAPAAPAHRAHLTLSAATVVDAEAVVDCAARIALRHKPIRVTLTRVGCFPRGGIVWLGPSRSDDLATLQRDAYTSLVEAGCPPTFADQSDPDRWVAHCKVGVVRRPGRAVPGELSLDPPMILAVLSAS